MKRVFNLVLAGLLVVGVGVGSAAVSPAAEAAVVPAGSLVTPDGKVVTSYTLGAGVKPDKAKKVAKGKPALPSTVTNKTGLTTASIASGCDGTGTSACYLYNVGSQAVTSEMGIQANNRVGGYSGALNTATDWHTLGELSVSGGTTLGQTIEVGWTSDPNVNFNGSVGTTTPRMFVFTWVNGVPGVYNGGPYHALTGAAVVPGVTDLTPGTVVSTAVQHDDAQHVWWIKWGTSFVGYYADSVWTGATPSVTYDRFTYYQLFGEIASSESKPCSDMGSGYLPSDTTNASRFSSTQLLHPDGTSDFTSSNLYIRAAAGGSISASNAASPYAGTVAVTGNHSFYYGGPMWNAAGTAAGTRAAC